jgi:hypothetical protein
MPSIKNSLNLFQALAAGQFGYAIGLIVGYLKKNVTFKSYVNRRILVIAVGDETTAISAGTNKYRFRMPYAMKLTDVKLSLNVAGTVSVTTVDVNEEGTSVLSTKATIDISETTSKTAAAAEVISDTTLAEDALISIDIDAAGTNAAGLKVYLIGEEIVS